MLYLSFLNLLYAKTGQTKFHLDNFTKKNLLRKDIIDMSYERFYIIAQTNLMNLRLFARDSLNNFERLLID